jgi:hypothetical protein
MLLIQLSYVVAPRIQDWSRWVIAAGFADEWSDGWKSGVMDGRVE